MVEDTTAQKIPGNLLMASPLCDESRSREPSRPPRSRKPYDFAPDSPSDSGTPVLREPVRATLNPYSPMASGQPSPRPSGEWGRNSINLDRKSFDVSRRSMDVGRKNMDLTGRDFRRASSERGRRSASQSRKRMVEQRPGSRTPSTIPQASTESFVHPEQGYESSVPNFSSNNTQASGSQILDRSDVFQSPTIQHLPKSPTRTTDGGRRNSVGSAHAKSSVKAARIEIRPPTRSQTDQSMSEQRQAFEIRPSQLAHSNSSPTLQQLVKAGGYPLQKAGRFADYLKTRSKRMSKLMAAESMGYVEKVSGMLAGGRKHYVDRDGIDQDVGLESSDVEDNVDGSGDRFRAYFALPPTEKLRAVFFGYLHRGVPLFGKLYLSDRRLCFRSLMTKTKMIVPFKDVETVDKEKGFRFGYSGLVVMVRGHEELFFDFKSHEIRNDCAVTILKFLESTRDLLESGILTQEDKEEAEMAKAEHKLLLEARKGTKDGLQTPDSAEDIEHHSKAPPILFDDPRASILNFKPTESLRVTCLTIGSRGDVQPYIALCKGLLKEGHKPRIATHVEFEGWIRKHGIDFAPVDGDPAELMRKSHARYVATLILSWTQLSHTFFLVSRSIRSFYNESC